MSYRDLFSYAAGAFWGASVAVLALIVGAIHTNTIGSDTRAAVEVIFSPVGGAVIAGATLSAILATALFLRLTNLLLTNLQKSEAENKAIVDTAVDGIVTINPDGTVRTFNHAAEKLFGYDAAEVRGQNVSMLMPTPYREAHDGHLARYHASGEARIIGIGRELLGQKKDGSVFPIDLAVSEIDSDDARGFTGIIRDISDRKAAMAWAKRTDRALRRIYEIGSHHGLSSEKKVAALLRMACEYSEMEESLVLRVDGPHLITVQSHHEKGTPRAIGTPIRSSEREILRPCLGKDGPSVIADLKSHRGSNPGSKEGRSWEYTGSLISLPLGLTDRRQGCLAIMSSTPRHSPFAPTDGEILRLLAQVMGAELRAREEQSKLLQAEKLSSIGLLAAGVAHEVNNPLAGVMAGVEALRKGQVPKERQQDYFDIMADGLARIQKTIKGLLDYARPKSRAPQDVDLCELLEASLRLVHANSHKKGLLVEQQTPDKAPIVHGDKSQLMQAFVNILLNAIHAAPSHSRLTICCQQEESQVTVEVIDDGEGIAEENLNRLCDPFFSTKAEGEGTGLGLSITLGIVEANHGRLAFANEPGRGAKVSVTLPRVD